MALIRIVIKREDFERLVESPSNLRDKSIFRILYDTGLRCGELVKIKIGDLDLDAKTVTIMDSKKHEKFTIPLTLKTCSLLREYISNNKEIRKAKKHNWGNWLFPSVYQKGSYLTREAISRIIKMYAGNLNLNGWYKFSPRFFRYRMARNWIDKKGSLTGLQEILRHKVISSTALYVDSIRFGNEIREEYDRIMGL